jgi:hypothetical protein
VHAIAETDRLQGHHRPLAANVSGYTAVQHGQHHVVERVHARQQVVALEDKPQLPIPQVSQSTTAGAPSLSRETFSCAEARLAMPRECRTTLADRVDVRYQKVNTGRCLPAICGPQPCTKAMCFTLRVEEEQDNDQGTRQRGG